MKKNFFKKLALVMALTLAVGSVPATNVEAAAAPKFKSEAKGANLVEGQTKNYGIANVSAWSVKKIVVGNKKVATVKKSGKTAKISGVAEGKTTVRADLMAYKSKRTTSIRIKVNVKAAETPVVEAKLTDVKLTASNAFKATFAADASKKFTKENFSVKAADGSEIVMDVKTVEFAADGLSAIVTTHTNFQNGVTYNVTCGETTLALPAAIGAVANVVIKTASAQKDVKTPIEFILTDATGIDVTPSINVDTTCDVSVTGDYAGVELARASQSSLIMNTVGAVANVTVSYNSNVAGVQDVIKTQQVTCIPATAVKGNAIFVDSADINMEDDNQCAKFYLGLSDSKVTVEEEAETEDVYFCAKDSKGDVISYDSYTATSSNDKIMDVEVTKDNGKFAQLTVKGYSIGTAQVSIAASKNGEIVYYTIPVSVVKKDTAIRLEVSVNRPVMSNVEDDDYKATVTAQLYDANNKKVEGVYNYTVINNPTATGLKGIEQDSSNPAVFTAAKATPNTYTIQVTGSDNKGRQALPKKVSIQVKALPTEPKKVTYQVELNENLLKNNTLDLADVTKTANVTLNARLYASYDGLFAGYVRKGSTPEVGTDLIVHDNNKLKSVSVLVRYGNLLFNTDSQLLGDGTKYTDKTAYTGILEELGADADMSYECTDNTDTIDYTKVDDGQKVYDTLARTGEYVLEYALEYTNGAKETKTKSFFVTNSIFVPTVTVLSKTVSEASIDGIAPVLKTDVDMNNNTSEHESFVEIYDAQGDTITAVNVGATRVAVKYAVVKDTFNGVEWNFWIPINTTFNVY